VEHPVIIKKFKDVFPSLRFMASPLGEKVSCLDPEYSLPTITEFTDLHNKVWDSGLSVLKEKAIRLSWVGAQCEDFALMSVAGIRKLRLEGAEKEYLPWPMGYAIGKHFSMGNWYEHSWNVVLTTSGVYCANYEFISKDYKRFKPQAVRL
jgi:hypothetical protein